MHSVRALFIRSRLFFPLLLTLPVHAALELASPFSDHMVLQRGQPVPVWGTASPGDRIVVAFANQEKSVVASFDGSWRVELDPLQANTAPGTLRVSNRGGADAPPGLIAETRRVGDVLVGEVWLCSGQSNMERQLGPRGGQKPIVNWKAEVAAANYPRIRQLYVTQTTAPNPQASAKMSWTVCSPETASNFTAVGYFFARDLHLKLGVPVGIIHSSWGGTPAEAWTSAPGLRNFADFREALKSVAALADNPDGAHAAHLADVEAWYRRNDRGSVSASWADPALDTSEWSACQQPGRIEDAGQSLFDGIIWLRRGFDLPPTWKGGDITLRLGAIDDIDTTWVNGVQVGAGEGWDVPRSYRVPGSVLKPAGNVIAIRVLDTGGNGGLTSGERPEAHSLDGDFAPLPLSGSWLLRYSSELAGIGAPPKEVSQSPGTPSVLYNGMIAPLVPYALRGATFYQGENNQWNARLYRHLLPALITDWRKSWGADFPFLFVQIAPFKDMNPDIREAQLIAWQRTPKTAMVVTIDCGDADDIHPADKAPVGARLALAARALAYDEAIEYSGPVFTDLKIQGNRAVLSFKHLGGGLVAKDGPLTGFVIGGADGVLHPAEARIVGETVEVSSPAVAQPTRVRYAYASVAAGNLFNQAGLPASPFRTDSN